jgi:hypothetical protein
VRITQQALNLEDLEVRDVTVEVSNDAVPTPGDVLPIDDEFFRVIAVYPMGQVSQQERAVVLTVRRDRMDGTGVRESPSPPWPPSFEAGAEANPPDDQ